MTTRPAKCTRTLVSTPPVLTTLVIAMSAVMLLTAPAPTTHAQASRPPAPTDFAAVAGDAEARLFWETQGDGGSAITRHQYRQSTDGEETWTGWTDIPSSADSGANANSYTLSGLKNNTTYSLQIRATNAQGDGERSETTTFTPLSVEAFELGALPRQGTNSFIGCSDASRNVNYRCTEVLSDGGRFDLGPLSFKIVMLEVETDDHVLLMIDSADPYSDLEKHAQFFEEMKERLILVVDEREFFFNDRGILQQNTVSPGHLTYTTGMRLYWRGTGAPGWSLSEMPDVNLNTGQGLANDSTPPTLTEALVHGREIKLDFSEVLDKASLPGPSAFTVMVNGVNRNVTGVPSRAAFEKDPVTGAITESELILTLESPVQRQDKVTVSYTPPSPSGQVGSLRDLAHNRVAAFSNVPVSRQGYQITFNPVAALFVADDVGYEELDGSGSVDFEVSLYPAQGGTVTVDYTTSDGTALAGEDYTATQGTLTFAPRETVKTISVPVIDDVTEDSDETFILTLSNASGASIVDAYAIGTIVNSEANTPATGSPTISGTARVGETLTAHTSGISDADGLTKVSYSYQWITGDADIAGATASTYTLTADEQGKAIKVKVSFTDDADNEESLTSEATAAVSSVLGALTASISSQPDFHDGENPFEFELQFSINPEVSYLTLRNTAFTVTGGTVTSASRLDSPSNIRWRIRITPDSTASVSVTLPASANCDDAGTICTEDGKQLTGDLTLLVPGPGTQQEPTQQEDEPNNPASGSPTITGTATVGKTLTAHTSKISDADGLTNVSYSYQWIAGDADIANATASTYTLTANEQGKAIRVRVSFTDDADNEESLTSEATAAVAARPNNAATGAPSISGTAQVGHTLTASLGSIGDADGINNAVFAYQWLRDGEDISSTAGSSYTLVDADEGAAISVRVSFTDDRANSESLTSQATAEVAGRPPLTASVSNAAASHDGSNKFTFELHFSEEFPLSYKVLKFDAFTVSGGSVKKSQRMQKPRNIQWLVTVQPSGNGTVIVILPETADCSANGAICTEDGRKLSHQLKVNVGGPDG